MIFFSIQTYLSCDFFSDDCTEEISKNNDVICFAPNPSTLRDIHSKHLSVVPDIMNQTVHFNTFPGRHYHSISKAEPDCIVPEHKYDFCKFDTPISVRETSHIHKYCESNIRDNDRLRKTTEEIWESKMPLGEKKVSTNINSSVPTINNFELYKRQTNVNCEDPQRCFPQKIKVNEELTCKVKDYGNIPNQFRQLDHVMTNRFESFDNTELKYLLPNFYEVANEFYSSQGCEIRFKEAGPRVDDLLYHKKPDPTFDCNV